MDNLGGCTLAGKYSWGKEYMAPSVKLQVMPASSQAQVSSGAGNQSLRAAACIMHILLLLAPTMHLEGSWQHQASA